MKTILLGAILLLAMATGPAFAEEQTLTGTFTVKFVDFDPDLGIPAELHYLLIDKSGQLVRLDMDAELVAPYGGYRALLKETITVRGERDGSRLVVAGLDAEIQAAKKHPVPVSGTKRQVTLMLRYNDDPSFPRTKAYFEFMYTSSTFPGTNHYIKEASYNIANIDGSQVFGWYDLPGNWSYYNWDKNGNNDPEFDLERALPDALNQADFDVDFSHYETLNFVMNGHIACDNGGTSCAWSRPSVMVDRDSTEPFSMGFTIMGLWGHDRMAVVPHETLHTWGLDHSGSYVGFPYDSNWDVMSGQGLNWHPTYGHLTVYGISYHMLGMGWIPFHRSWDTGVIRAGIIQIEHLEFPPLVPGTYAMAKARIGGYADYFYTVEYRTLDGWDGSGGVPGQAVLLHKVDTTRGDQQALVVDVDLNGDPNDAAAMWLPGETFLHQMDQVIVHVEGWNSTTATVSLSNRALINVYVDHAAPEPGYGTPADPWNTVEEGYASVFQGGPVYITPGTYSESMRMTKPCRLQRLGSSGVVRIGG